MEKQLISVIVPIYNTALYLTECLESLKNQTYPYLEIIIINDGSTDSSAEICHRFCNEDKRFVLVEQGNKGLGPTRNVGLETASGDYICMVDSDDVVHSRYIEVLYSNLKKYDADISMGNYVKFSDELPLVTEAGHTVSELIKKELIKDISTAGPHNRSEKVVVCWNKLMKRELWTNLRFPTEYHEDEFVILDLILQSRKFVYTEDVLYFYRQRPESIMGKNQSVDIRHLSLLKAIYGRIERLSGQEYSDVFPAVLQSYFENAVILYFSFLPGIEKREVKHRIFPQYRKVLCKYAHRMTVKKVIRYGLFLFAPEYYRRRYWQ